MSYIKNAFCNHIYIMGTIDNNDPDELGDIIGSSILCSDGTVYFIDDIMTYSDGSIDICVNCFDEMTGYFYDMIPAAAFIDIVKNAVSVDLPAES